MYKMKVIWPTYKKAFWSILSKQLLPNSQFVEHICPYISLQSIVQSTEYLLRAYAFKMAISYFWSSILARRIAQPCQELPDDNYVTTV